ncbi:hypothetical protein A3770_02p14600 [Chloropicon primus]|uniref:Uncharacterized protein n=1 Tax=Chloropicon primus TaxID=1764295 RepID=A0A5B8MHU6_9CHLO|nr:hypothetical protein A3770_02p14600 [Chloropicon primus]|eukprot:QDZ18942.1 hypothetical protein A3770_02p14600 [Chloropicon primus]
MERERRRSFAVEASLTSRLQRSENELHRLTRLNEQKDSALRILLVMKSLLMRKLGSKAASTLFEQEAPSDPGFPSYSGPPPRPRVAHEMPGSTPSREYHTPSQASTKLRSYTFGGGSPSVLGQVSLDMERYAEELSEVFQEEIASHRKVKRDVELVTNDLENMFLVEDYLRADAELQDHIHRNEVLQNEIARHTSGLSGPQEARRYNNTEKLQHSVLEDILGTRQTRQELCVRHLVGTWIAKPIQWKSRWRIRKLEQMMCRLLQSLLRHLVGTWIAKPIQWKSQWRIRKLEQMMCRLLQSLLRHLVGTWIAKPIAIQWKSQW